jgi:hypothetical protein
MRRALWSIPLALVVLLLGGCGQRPTTSNDATTPLSPVSRCCGGEPESGIGIYTAPVTYPPVTTKNTVPYPPYRKVLSNF